MNSSYLLSGKWKAVGKQDESVFATLELSFDAIQKQNPRAAELLLLCGFMDNEDIPEELLRRGMEQSAGGMRRPFFIYIYNKLYNTPTRIQGTFPRKVHIARLLTSSYRY